MELEKKEGSKGNPLCMVCNPRDTEKHIPCVTCKRELHPKNNGDAEEACDRYLGNGQWTMFSGRWCDHCFLRRCQAKKCCHCGKTTLPPRGTNKESSVVVSSNDVAGDVPDASSKGTVKLTGVYDKYLCMLRGDDQSGMKMIKLSEVNFDELDKMIGKMNNVASTGRKSSIRDASVHDVEKRL